MQIQTALVIGGGRGLGLSLAKVILAKHPEAKVFATYRSAEKAQGLLSFAEPRLTALVADPTRDEDLERLAAQLGPSSLDLILIATGFLHDDGKDIGPERTVREVSVDHLLESFRVNACVTPLVAKHLAKSLKRDGPAVLAALSAQVGSIGDNHLGGWYGYRASKAALNMFIKTLSIELARTVSKHLRVMAIHPGTTETDLSRPFLKNVKHHVFQPPEAAEKILAVIESSGAGPTGSFKNFEGADLPW